MRSLLPIRNELGERFSRPLDRFFDDFFGEGWLSPFTATSGFEPAMDVRERDDAYVARFEVPGVAKDALEIDYLKDRLTVRGEKKHEAEGESDGTTWRETHSGRFERSIRFALPIDVEKVAAKLEDGVLEVTLPKAPEAKAQKIDVKGA